MSFAPGNKVLFVDDEPSMREIMAILLHEDGYEVLTASDGLDALMKIRVSTPDLIISDLHMPRMSGTELLSVVRRRFPSIPSIAMSESYERSDRLPPDVMADAFYPKERCNPDEFLRTVANLIRNSTKLRKEDLHGQPPAVQQTRVVRDLDGSTSLKLNCPDCLRAFSPDPGRASEGVQETRCPSCAATVRFVTDTSPEFAHRSALETGFAARSSRS